MERLSAAIKLIEAAPEFADTKGLRCALPQNARHERRGCASVFPSMGCLGTESRRVRSRRSILKSPNQVFELRVRWKGQLVATRLFTAVNEEPEAAAPAAAPSRVSGRERKAKREWCAGLSCT